MGGWDYGYHTRADWGHTCEGCVCVGGESRTAVGTMSLHSLDPAPRVPLASPGWAFKGKSWRLHMPSDPGEGTCDTCFNGLPASSAEPGPAPLRPLAKPAGRGHQKAHRRGGEIGEPHRWRMQRKKRQWKGNE